MCLMKSTSNDFNYDHLLNVIIKLWHNFKHFDNHTQSVTTWTAFVIGRREKKEKTFFLNIFDVMVYNRSIFSKLINFLLCCGMNSAMNATGNVEVWPKNVD